MAALPYMQLYVADYLADTSHLSTVEHGAYLLLIFNYWQRGEPFRAKDQRTLNKRLAIVARMSDEEWENVSETLKDFFEVSENEWSHRRIDRDLERVNAKSTKAKAAGMMSAQKKRELKDIDNIEDFNERSTNVETNVQRKANHTYTDTDTYTEIKEKNNKKESPKNLLADFGVTGQLADDFIRHRNSKKAPITKTALNGFSRESIKAKISIHDAIQVSIERGWIGFRADWYFEKQQRESNHDRNARKRREAIYSTDF